MKEKRENYNFNDSSYVYILAILVPIIVLFFLLLILTIISKNLNTTVEVLTKKFGVYCVLLLISQGSLLVLAFLYSKYNKINIYKATSINKKINLYQILVVLGIAISSLILFTPLINYFDAVIHKIGYNNSSELPFKIDNWFKYIISIFVLGLLPAVCEEVIFRGIIFNGIRKKYNIVVAVIVSAICFAVMHMSLQQLVYPLLLGVVLALIVYYTNSLRASMLTHFTNNFIVITLTFFSTLKNKTQESLVSLSWQNLVVSILYFIIGIAFVVVLSLFLKKIKSKNQTEEYKQENLKLDSPLEQELKNKKDKSELIVFSIFIAISLIIWVVENISYFK